MQKHLLQFNTLDSTNKFIAREYKNLSPNVLVVAAQQTDGQGQQGKQWLSPLGNFYGSFYRVYRQPAHELQTLALQTANEVANLLATTFQVTDLSLKHPNDILLQNKKLAGILAETIPDIKNNLTHAIIGIGVNIMHAPSTSQATISLWEAGYRIDLQDFITQIQTINLNV